MYTNTIYILNNIIFECFDIDFKEKTKTPKEKSFHKKGTNNHVYKLLVTKNHNLNIRKMNK